MYSCYHRHSFYSNIITPDSTVSNEDYALRAVELGHKLLSGVEHAWTGRSIEVYELAKQYNLKFLFGTETYIVKDRFEKDRTNAHLILLAKNENGRKNINRILSEANLTGFYYRARIDFDLLFSLPKNDVWITTACLGGLWKYDDADDLILKIKDHFQHNFFLEVQNHNTQSQADLNAHIIQLSNKNNIPIIFGCDSHYIYPAQADDRDDYLLSKHVTYEDESGWYMDFPDEKTAIQRFKSQGILSNAQIQEALENTNQFLEVEEYTSEIFNTEVKLPSIYSDKTQEEKNEIFSKLVWNQWEKEKENVAQNRLNTYETEIKKEEDIVIETGMADYFLLDYEIVKRGKELGGHITLTGRGSAPSFYISKLLGFTTVDRISAPVKLFPERFITKERILEAKTLPDIDFNLGNPEIFAQAQIDVLGENHSYPMVAFGTLQPKAAWKLYARAKNIDFTTANLVSMQIQQYEMDLIHADEDEKDDINVLDYIEEDYHDLFMESRKYLGIVSDAKIHPCLDKNTSILTKCGYKSIDKIVVGDLVLTHNHRYKKVINIMNREVDKIYKLKIGSFYYNVTGNHPFFVITNFVDKYGNIISRSKPYWKSVDQIQKNDLIGFAINQESIIPKYDDIPIDNENFWWLIGHYLGNGYLSGSDNKSSYRINISTNHEKQIKIEEILNSLNQQYHIANNKETHCEIAFYNKKYWDFISLFGKYSYGKFLPGFVFDLPTNLLKSLLDGYFYADGFQNHFEMIYVTVSKELALGIQTCVHKVYRKPCSIRVKTSTKGQINGKNFVRKAAYVGRFAFNADKKPLYIYKDGYIWIRYNGKQVINKKQLVYNIEVEDDNSYTANNAIVHNCAYLLYDKNIKEEIGLIKVKENICVAMDGLWAEKYSFLKNDLLKVAVVELIYRIYEKVGLEPHPFPELLRVCSKDEKPWQVYKNAWVLGINQVEKTSTSGRVAKYAPQNISELSAFIAAIRPGFKSNYKQFESREPFSYGIPSFDNVIQTKEFPQSYLLYQENAMQAMAYAGIPISETYEVVKNIAKKRAEKVYKYKDQFIDGMTKKIMRSEQRNKEDAENIAHQTWQIIEDSARYSFNSSHSLCYAGDSLYGAYLKSNYPFEFYEIFLNLLEEDGDKNRMVRVIDEAQSAFGIIFPVYKFGQDNRKIVSDSEKNQITSSLSSIKGFSKSIGENMYELGQKEYKDFLELLTTIEECGMMTKKLEELIKINYFDMFGGNSKLLKFYNEFTSGKNRYSKKHSDKTKEKRLSALQEYWESLPDEKLSIHQQIESEKEILGNIHITYPKIDKRFVYIIDVDTKFAPRSEMYCLATGKRQSIKIQNKIFDNKPFFGGEILKCKNFKKKPSVKFDNGQFVEVEDQYTWWLESYSIIELDKFDKMIGV